jgi:hypothetical protein
LADSVPKVENRATLKSGDRGRNAAEFTQDQTHGSSRNGIEGADP